MGKNIQFLGLNGRILLEAPGAIKSVALKALKPYTNNLDSTTGFGSALERLEAEPFDWVIQILPKSPETPEHIQLLELCTKIPELRSLRVSIIYHQETPAYLHESYERGLLSHHECEMTTDGFTQAFSDLAEKTEQFNCNATLIASHYLRNLLEKEKNFKGLVSLSKRFAELYPHSAENLLLLARALLLNGEVENAISAGFQAKFISQKVISKVDQLFEEFGIENPKPKGTSHNILGVERCAVIDSDDAVTHEVATIMNELGVPQTDIYNNGNEAFTAISESSEKPDVIIMEWKIPGLTGPMLLQRLRHAGLTEATVVILSSLINKKEAPILREMTVSQISEKPLKRDKLVKSLITAVYEAKAPTTLTNLEAKIKKELAANNPDKAEKTLDKFTSEFGPLPIHWRSKAIVAHIGYSRGQFNNVIKLVYDAIKEGGDTIDLMNLMGKTFMQVGNFADALKAFEKAQQSSSLNIERLCKIAECHSEMGDQVKANKTLAKAKSLDPHGNKTKETESNILISTGDSATAKQIMSSLNSINNVISFMNNRAVAFSRSGNVEASIDLYRKAIKAIPDSRAEWKPIIYYNLALAYVKNGELDEAAIPLEKAIQNEEATVYKKAKNLTKRVDHAIHNNIPLELNIHIKKDGNQQLQLNKEASAESNQPEVSAISQERQIIRMALEITPGQMCCYLLYQAPIPIAHRVTQALANIQKYKPRDTIVKNANIPTDKAS